VTTSDLLLAYASIGASLATVSVVRLFRSGPSMAHLRRAAFGAGMPVWAAALIMALSLVTVAFEYAALWPLRWRDALR
jgi:hypothetical protein